MGFDTELFTTKPIDSNFICTICHAVLEKPVSVCEHSHVHCAECIVTWSRRSRECPDCRSPLLEHKLLNRPVQNLIFALQVSCPETNECESETTSSAKRARLADAQDASECSSSNKECCGWQGTLSDYLEHHRNKDCCFGEVACPLGCKKMIRAFKLEAHKESECRHRTVTCSLCNETMKQYLLLDHEKRNCPKAMAACRYCGEEMIREDLGLKPGLLEMDDAEPTDGNPKYTKHYKTCPKLEVKCEFHHQGCWRSIPRENLDEHHAKFARQHARMVGRELESIRNGKYWTAQNIYWKIPASAIREAIGNPTITLLKESKRVKVGDFDAFVRLAGDENGVVHVSVGVDRPSLQPFIDKLSIHEINDCAWMWLPEEQKMQKDARRRTWSMGGPLRRIVCDIVGNQVDECDVILEDLLEWMSNGEEEVCLCVGFRLKGPEAVTVGCEP